MYHTVFTWEERSLSYRMINVFYNNVWYLLIIGLAHSSISLGCNNCLWWLCLEKYEDNNTITTELDISVQLWNCTKYEKKKAIFSFSLVNVKIFQLKIHFVSKKSGIIRYGILCRKLVRWGPHCLDPTSAGCQIFISVIVQETAFVAILFSLSMHTIAMFHVNNMAGI